MTLDTPNGTIYVGASDDRSIPTSYWWHTCPRNNGLCSYGHEPTETAAITAAHNALDNTP